MPIVLAVVLALFGLAVVLNVRGLAQWGSEDRWRRRDADGQARQVQRCGSRG